MIFAMDLNHARTVFNVNVYGVLNLLDQPFEMPSGAGHDAAVFAKMGIPTAMLFMRNEHGSHNPEEALALEDFDVATRALLRLLLDFPL